MSNVLPPEFQTQGRKDALSRVALLSSVALLLSALASLLALIPSFGHSAVAVPQVATSTISAAQIKEATDQLKSAQTLLTLVAPTVGAQNAVSDVLSAVTKSRPAGITITSITYGLTNGKGARGVLTLSGTTKTRADIAAFRVALVRTNLFDTVSLPVGVLVDSNASSFDMSVSGNF